MSNQNKREGTNWEQQLVRTLQDAGLKAWPLARRGPSDPGDVVVVTPGGDHIIIEARSRERMSVHPELETAKWQTAHADLPFIPAAVVIVWKRMWRKPGNERRTRIGEPVVVMGLADWVEMLTEWGGQ